MLSAGLVLATVDDSAKRLMDAGSEKLGAIVGHKYGLIARGWQSF